MPEQITTAAELDSLPIGSVVMTETHRGFGGGYEQRVWMRHGGQGSPLIHDWQSTDGGFQRVGEPEHARGMWAVNRNVTVLYRPDAPSLGADDQAGGPLEGAPKPSAETVADALIRYETGGMCYYGRTCGTCDCGRSSLTVEGLAEQDAMELGRARAVLALIPPQRCAPSEAELIAVLIGCLGRDDYLSDTVRAITKLYSDQPTVAQAKAEGIREVGKVLGYGVVAFGADKPEMHSYLWSTKVEADKARRAWNPYASLVEVRSIKTRRPESECPTCSEEAPNA